MKSRYVVRIGGFYVPVKYKDRYKLVEIKHAKSGIVLFRAMPQKAFGRV